MLHQAVRPESQVPPVEHVVTFKQFHSVKPPKFEGSADPTKAKAWLKEMEKAFVLVKVKADQKTDFASYFLKGEANYPWESKKALEGEGVVTWDRFTGLLLEKYFPRYMKNQIEIKFLELKQGNLSVTDYKAKFTELARFVPEQVDTDKKRAKIFQQGLKPWIRSRIAMFELTTYTAKGHYSGECPTGKTDVTYFQYGRKGHITKDCRGTTITASVPRVLELPPPPQQNQPRARTFNMSIKEAVQSPNVVASTLPVNFVDAQVLIDSRATRFFFEEFIHKIYFQIQRLDETLIIKLANDDQIAVDCVCPGCDIEIAGHHISVDLLTFMLGEFDIILGIDWLASNNAQIDCANKKVNLRTEKNATLTFKGEK
ncbi:uncharacterized protein LOC141691956 [Apium graveolens]|uniref:uncharacterized protein LOC141691956 n=1 Tax=Apium graveolens TaxID=4045 RepID=UPI003D7A6087